MAVAMPALIWVAEGSACWLDSVSTSLECGTSENVNIFGIQRAMS